MKNSSDPFGGGNKPNLRARNTFSLLTAALLMAAAACTDQEPREQNLLKLIHERPMVADRVAAAILAESHGTEILEKQLKKHPASAKVLVEAMLADPELGPMVRERCAAHLASRPVEKR